MPSGASTSYSSPTGVRNPYMRNPYIKADLPPWEGPNRVNYYMNKLARLDPVWITVLQSEGFHWAYDKMGHIKRVKEELARSVKEKVSDRVYSNLAEWSVDIILTEPAPDSVDYEDWEARKLHVRMQLDAFKEESKSVDEKLKQYNADVIFMDYLLRQREWCDWLEQLFPSKPVVELSHPGAPVGGAFAPGFHPGAQMNRGSPAPFQEPRLKAPPTPQIEAKTPEPKKDDSSPPPLPKKRRAAKSTAKARIMTQAETEIKQEADDKFMDQVKALMEHGLSMQEAARTILDAAHIFDENDDGSQDNPVVI